jgi:O-6-methylguanine DNA methyltransferase
MTVHRVPIATCRGTFVACFSERGLVRLNWPTDKPVPKRTLTTGHGVGLAKVRRWRQLTDQALRRALAGRAPSRLPPLDLSAGTAFQRRVWRLLRRIPLGQTWSYAQVAAALGAPAAARAVGQACGANPIPVLVPCHRVRRSDGSLGGFSGGLAWKRWLLAQEARAGR